VSVNTPSSEQRSAALVLANERRAQIAAAKRDLRSGVLSLDDVLSNPPDALASVALVDLIRWCRSRSPLQRQSSLIRIGRRAVSDNVNLLVPLGEASVRSRDWVAEWGQSWRRRA
jgi:hypothetical protein